MSLFDLVSDTKELDESKIQTAKKLIASIQIDAIDTRDSHGRTVLMCAANHNHESIASLLIEAKADIDCQDQKGDTALHIAAWKDHKEIVINLIKFNADINLKSKDGCTAIMFAIGIPEVKKGSHQTQTNLNLLNSRGNTALIEAVDFDRIEMTRKLIACQLADLNIQNLSGKTALMYAALFDKKEMLSNLMAARNTDQSFRVNPNIQSNNGDTALTLAAWKGHKETAFVLINSNRVNLNLATKSGLTALMLAIDHLNRDIAHQLIEFKAELDVENNEGNTALIFAAAHGCEDIVIKLIGLNSNFNHRNKLGETAIIKAAVYGRDNIVCKLIEFPDTKIDMANNNGMTALMIAAGYNYKKILSDLMNSKHADESWRVNPNSQSYNGDTALTLSAWKGHKECAFVLIESERANLDLQTQCGHSALTLAAEHNHIEIVRKLIEYNAALNLQISNKMGTALLLAVSCNHTEIAFLLIAAGADINLTNSRNESPIGWAIHKKNFFLISELLKHGAVLKNPNALLKLLDASDLRELYTDTCFESFYQQQTILREAKVPDEKLIALDAKEYKHLGVCSTKLKTLNKQAVASVRNSLNDYDGARSTLFIIQSYDIPLEGERLRFFKPAEILTAEEMDSPAPTVAVAPAPTVAPPPKRKKRCIIM